MSQNRSYAHNKTDHMHTTNSIDSLIAGIHFLYFTSRTFLSILLHHHFVLGFLLQFVRIVRVEGDLVVWRVRVVDIVRIVRVEGDLVVQRVRVVDIVRIVRVEGDLVVRRVRVVDIVRIVRAQRYSSICVSILIREQ